MARLGRLGLSAALLVALATPAQKPGSPPAGELKKLRALLVFDTDSDLEAQLRIDQGQLRRLLEKNVPPERLEVTVLTGKDVTREKVLAHYRDLKTGPDEALFFFYGGHGARDPKKGEYLALKHAPPSRPLLRSELRRALRAKRPGLVAIVTDCCSDTVRIPPPPPGSMLKEMIGAMPKKEVIPLHPMFRVLFFQARGVVDVTAATRTSSWGDNEHGGLFTRSFCGLVSRTIDPPKAGITSWRTFFEKLRADTQELFRAWAPRVDPRGSRVDPRKPQTPEALLLDETAPRPATATSPAGTTYAVVSLENKKPADLSYRWRWQGEPDWKTQTLRPGQSKVYARPAGPSGQMPRLEVALGKRVHQLDGKPFAGTRPPTAADARKYHVRPPTPADKKPKDNR